MGTVRQTVKTEDKQSVCLEFSLDFCFLANEARYKRNNRKKEKHQIVVTFAITNNHHERKKYYNNINIEEKFTETQA